MESIKQGIDDTKATYGFSSSDLADSSDDDQLQTVIFICNVHQDVFTVATIKEKFEQLFDKTDLLQFIYLPSFRRVRVDCNTPQEAANVKRELNGTMFLDTEIKVFYGQSKKKESAPVNLAPPPLEKQFLISPPASPPVGWEPVEENKPAFNFDLISSIVEMAPGQSHELHEGSENVPSVVVHVCENRKSDDVKLKIQQTRRPGS